MSRPPKFTDAEVAEWRRRLEAHEITVTNLALELKTSRQTIAHNLYHRGESKLPPPTREERANIQHARERKAELTAKARAPTLDEITDWVIKAATALKEIDKVRNVSAATIAQLRQENERLKGRLSLLDKAEEQKRAYALALQQGEIGEPLLPRKP